MEERLNFTDWIKWAETTNSLGIANVEPAIILFLKDTSNNSNIFTGKQWDGKNWLDISVKFRKILEDKVLNENPSKYTLPVVIGQSVTKKNYHGIDEDYLKEALKYVTDEHWETFLNEYTHIIKDYSSLSRIQIIRLLLVGLVRLYIPNEVPAQSYKDYLLIKRLL